MTGNRVYLQPRGYILDTIHDLKEMQKGKGTFSDIGNGKISYSVRLYYNKWEYRFTVSEIGVNRCNVEIVVDGDVRDKEDVILRQFALLDSMLITNTKIELVKQKK